jgi:hypothetical protein
MSDNTVAAAAAEPAAASAEKAPNDQARQIIETLRERRDTWTNGSLRAANEELYKLLSDCFGFYELLIEQTNRGEALRDNFSRYLKTSGLRFDGATHTLVKIARVVFDTDPKRASAYGLVMRRAQQDGCTSGTLATYIRDNGGIEQIRLSKGGNAQRPSQEERGNQAYEEIKSTVLARVNTEALAQACDQGKAGEKVVLVATQEAGGKFVIHGLVTANSVVNAAFAAMASVDKARIVSVRAEAQARDKQDTSKTAREQAVNELLSSARGTTAAANSNAAIAQAA